MVPALAFVFVLASAEVTLPPKGSNSEKATTAQPEPTMAHRWAAVYQVLDEFKKKNTGFGPVAVYDVYGETRLPSRLVIVREAGMKTVVTGLLRALSGDDWQKDAWVLDRREAVREMAKALKTKDKEDLAEFRKKIDAELGPSVVLVYRIHREAAPEEEPAPTVGLLEDPVRGGKPAEPPKTSTGTR